MKEEITYQERSALAYRKMRLREKTEQVELLLSGQGESLLPFVRDEYGHYSEEKTRALCARLADPLSLDGEKRETLESFLYCALRLIEGDPFSFCMAGNRGSFRNLVRLARETDYWDVSELYYDELTDPNTAHGIFPCLDELCRALSGWDAAETISPEARAALPEHLRIRMEQELREREAAPAECSDVSDEEYSEIERARYDALSPEERQWEDEESARFREEEERKREWLAGFPDREALLQEYLRFRCLYAQGNLRGTELGKAAEEAVDLWLCRMKKAYFLEDDRYFYAYGLLDRAVRALREPPREEG